MVYGGCESWKNPGRISCEAGVFVCSALFFTLLGVHLLFSHSGGGAELSLLVQQSQIMYITVIVNCLYWGS